MLELWGKEITFKLLFDKGYSVMRKNNEMQSLTSHLEALRKNKATEHKREMTKTKNKHYH
jgi:hypothetical protein